MNADPSLRACAMEEMYEEVIICADLQISRMRGIEVFVIGNM